MSWRAANWFRFRCRSSRSSGSYCSLIGGMRPCRMPRWLSSKPSKRWLRSEDRPSAIAPSIPVDRASMFLASCRNRIPQVQLRSGPGTPGSAKIDKPERHCVRCGGREVHETNEEESVVAVGAALDGRVGFCAGKPSGYQRERDRVYSAVCRRKCCSTALHRGIRPPGQLSVPAHPAQWARAELPVCSECAALPQSHE